MGLLGEDDEGGKQGTNSVVLVTVQPRQQQRAVHLVCGTDHSRGRKSETPPKRGFKLLTILVPIELEIHRDQDPSNVDAFGAARVDGEVVCQAREVGSAEMAAS